MAYRNSAGGGQRSEKSKYYAVRVGRKVGIFATWKECRAQVSGFSGAIHKSFGSSDEAANFVAGGGVTGSHVTAAAAAAAAAATASTAYGGMGIERRTLSSAYNNSGAARKPKRLLASSVKSVNTAAIAATAATCKSDRRHNRVHERARLRAAKPSALRSIPSSTNASPSLSQTEGGKTVVPVAAVVVEQVHQAMREKMEEGKEKEEEKGEESNDAFWELYFDGGSRGNPGVAGAGATVYRNNSEVWAGRHYCGANHTNNFAEYKGLEIGLEAAARLGARHLVVYGDSKLVIEQMRGTWQVRSPNLVDLHARARAAAARLVSVEYKHVYRKFNKRADQLANEAMDARRGWNDE